MMTKDQILQAIHQYAQENLSKPFIPGKTYIHASGPLLFPEDVEMLADAVLGFWYTEWKYAAQFSRALSNYVGYSPYVTLCNSGSSASLLAITAAIEQSKKKNAKFVVTCALGFPTTASPIYQNGKIPLYIDIDPKTLSPRLDQLETAMSKYGKDICGVVLAHTLGFPFDELYVKVMAETMGAWFVADCCDGLGSRTNYSGVGSLHVGYHADFATLSFFPAHHITSLDYDEIIVIDNPRNAFGFSLMKIGDFVDVYKKDPDPYYYSVSFDASGKLAYYRITNVVKHPVNELLYKITVQTGRNIIVSSSHSLFTKSKYDDEIIPIETYKLSVGDFILAPKKLPSPYKGEVEFIEYIDYARGNWIETTKKLKVNSDLLRFLGLFVAEGSFNHVGKSGNYAVVLTFSFKELNYAKFCLEYAKSAFGVSGNIYENSCGHSVAVRLNGKGLYKFLELVCGKGAKNKMIPPFVYYVDDYLKWEFINGYFDGDGTQHFTTGLHKGYSRDAKTVSKCLAVGMFYLLLMLGVQPRWSEQEESTRNFGSYISKTRRVYNICFSEKSILDSVGFRSDRKSVRSVGDLVLAKITKIEQVLPTTKFVYDVSVDGIENFIGGVGIALHNTGEGGAVLTNLRSNYEVVNSLTSWGRSCKCLPGQDNVCGKRFEHTSENLPAGWDHKYTFERLGYNLKMTDLQAALGLSQLSHLSEFVLLRQRNFGALMLMACKYNIWLQIRGASAEKLWGVVSSFGFPIYVKPEAPFTSQELVTFLEEHKVGTRRMFGGNLTRQPAFENLDYVKMDLFGSDDVMERMFWISCAPSLTREMITYIEEVFSKFMEKYL